MKIDCAVHPVFTNAELNQAIGAPWNLLKLPPLFGEKYRAPFDQLTVSEDAASSPAALAERLKVNNIDYAVLTPTTRGYWPNPQQAGDVAKAANNLLCEKWLNAPEAEGKFLGSIRIALNDTDTALREIERWSEDERFVQIVVPARALATYGEQRFFPIWRAAAERGLVVFVHDDFATLVEPAPSQVGFPSYFAENHAIRPISSIVQLTSFIVAGVFERLPDLHVVFGDASLHAARSLLIRTDKDWQSDRLEVPWVTRDPTTYLEKQARFICQADDEISPHSFDAVETIGGDNASLILYGSRYPYWDGVEEDNLFTNWTAEHRRKIYSENTLSFYPRISSLVSKKVTY